MYQSLTSTMASPPANSKAIGAIFIGLKVFLSRVMSSQEAEAEAEDNPPIISRRGTRTAVFFVLDNHAVLRRETKTKLLSFDF